MIMGRVRFLRWMRMVKASTSCQVMAYPLEKQILSSQDTEKIGVSLGKSYCCGTRRRILCLPDLLILISANFVATLPGTLSYSGTSSLTILRGMWSYGVLRFLWRDAREERFGGSVSGPMLSSNFILISHTHIPLRSYMLLLSMSEIHIFIISFSMECFCI
ncbi:unnamed protein product [Brassica oleracea]|uniref:Uncharacterized protein n=2 Tax=Brassica TaxID=3705 RepID=A0A3P6F8Y2_BRAOL|nr:unnamed protein product [Brassica oleracea]